MLTPYKVPYMYLEIVYLGGILGRSSLKIVKITPTECTIYLVKLKTIWCKKYTKHLYSHLYVMEYVAHYKTSQGVSHNVYMASFIYYIHITDLGNNAMKSELLSRSFFRMYNWRQSTC